MVHALIECMDGRGHDAMTDEIVIVLQVIMLDSSPVHII
jgi:hypothetical protein